MAQDPPGTLRGEVQDSSDARLVEAKVKVRAAGSSLTSSATANKRGEFRIEGLLPGNYRVRGVPSSVERSFMGPGAKVQNGDSVKELSRT